MHTELKRGNHPRCSYESNGEHVAFTVVGAPEYGVLILADFTGDTPGAPHDRMMRR